MAKLRALLVCDSGSRAEDGSLRLVGIRRRFQTSADGSVVISGYAYVGEIDAGEFTSTMRIERAANNQILAQHSQGNEAFPGVDEYIEHTHAFDLAIEGHGEWQMWLVYLLNDEELERIPFWLVNPEPMVEQN